VFGRARNIPICRLLYGLYKVKIAYGSVNQDTLGTNELDSHLAPEVR